MGRRFLWGADGINEVLEGICVGRVEGMIEGWVILVEVCFREKRLVRTWEVVFCGGWVVLGVVERE